MLSKNPMKIKELMLALKTLGYLNSLCESAEGEVHTLKNVSMVLVPSGLACLHTKCDKSLN